MKYVMSRDETPKQGQHYRVFTLDNGTEVCKEICYISRQEGLDRLRSRKDIHLSSIERLHNHEIEERLNEEYDRFGLDEAYVWKVALPCLFDGYHTHETEI